MREVYLLVMQRIKKDGIYVRSVNTIVSDRKDVNNVVVG